MNKMSHHLASCRIIAVRLTALCSLSVALLAQGTAFADDPEKPVDFASQIRPILAVHCWTCHGPDEKSRTADLRLDIRENAIASSAIVPKDLGASKLVERILSERS